MTCLDENVVAELFEGVLPERERAHAEAHLDACPACRRLVAVLDSEISTAAGSTRFVEARSGPAVERGTSIGRYTVVDIVGAGNMGVVYVAYDPELDRRVALKRPALEDADDEDGRAARSRLLDEAKSMARLSHPNVVAVHDVVEVDGCLYVAMEYVDGETLTHWLAHPRSPAEILAVFRDAGEGLAAAHAVGVVHRDFKPDNVLVSDDDARVRVTDFGLAAATLSTTTTDADEAHAPRVVGTPRYMAPEQFRSEQVDPRCDQYSYCVALYEALYGAPPFEAQTLEELAAAKQAGRLATPASERPVEARVRKALLRGIAVDPADRFASIRDLLTALRPRRPVRVRLPLLAGSVVAVGAAAWAAASLQSGSDGCAAPALDDVWNEERSAAVAGAMASWPDGPTWARNVDAQLDAYVEQWERRYAAACETEPLAVEQIACLRARRRRLVALVDVLEELSPSAAPGAIDGVRRLPAPRTCVDPSWVRAAAAKTTLAADARSAVDRVHAMTDAGDSRRAADEAARLRHDLVDAAPAVRAAVTVAQARALANAGEWERAEATLHEALVHAERAGADDLRAEVMALLTWVAGMPLHRYDEADRHSEQALALTERIDAAPSLRARLWWFRGLTHQERGEFESAAETTRRAIASFEDGDLRDHPAYPKAIAALGNAYRGLQRLDEAEAEYRRALHVQRRLLGSNHPNVADSLHGLADVLSAQERYDEALAVFERALAIHERAAPPNPLDIAGAHVGIARAQVASAMYEDATKRLATAVSVLDDAGLDQHPLRATALATMAHVHGALGRHEKALETTLRGVEVLRGATPKHPDLAAALYNAGVELLVLDRPAEALDLFREAADLILEVLPPDHELAALAIQGQGRALFELERFAAADAALASALDLGRRSRPPLSHYHRFVSRWFRARALWALDRDRDAAIDLLETALRACDDRPGCPEDVVVEARTWLAQRHPNEDRDP